MGGNKNQDQDPDSKLHLNRDTSEENKEGQGSDLQDSGMSMGNTTNRKNRNNWAVKKDNQQKE